MCPLLVLTKLLASSQAEFDRTFYESAVHCRCTINKDSTSVLKFTHFERQLPYNLVREAGRHQRNACQVKDDPGSTRR